MHCNQIGSNTLKEIFWSMMKPLLYIRPPLLMNVYYKDHRFKGEDYSHEFLPPLEMEITAYQMHFLNGKFHKYARLGLVSRTRPW